MLDITIDIVGVIVITIGVLYRAATINSNNYLKDEDAFIPIRRKKGKVGIIRERVLWECGGILLNGIVFLLTIIIKTIVQGQVRFLYSSFFSYGCSLQDFKFCCGIWVFLSI